MFFVLYRDAAQQWRWSLYSEENKKIAESPEPYWEKPEAQHAVDLVKSTFSTTLVYER